MVLDQKDALHMCTCVHRDMARDLPEDFIRKCIVRQGHLLVRSLNQVPRNLDDVGACATEGDVSVEGDSRAKGVDAGRQCYIGEDGIFPRAKTCIAPRGFIVQYAVSMSKTAIPKAVATARLYSGAVASPVICVDVEKSLPRTLVKLKPVMAVASMGETAMSPVMAEAGTVEIPVLARIA
jgi:hypothetical protein